jgi:hypothetical protein
MRVMSIITESREGVQLFIVLLHQFFFMLEIFLVKKNVCMCVLLCARAGKGG